MQLHPSNCARHATSASSGRQRNPGRTGRPRPKCPRSSGGDRGPRRRSRRRRTPGVRSVSRRARAIPVEVPHGGREIDPVESIRRFRSGWNPGPMDKSLPQTAPASGSISPVSTRPRMKPGSISTSGSGTGPTRRGWREWPGSAPPRTPRCVVVDDSKASAIIPQDLPGGVGDALSTITMSVARPAARGRRPDSGGCTGRCYR